MVDVALMAQVTNFLHVLNRDGSSGSGGGSAGVSWHLTVVA